MSTNGTLLIDKMINKIIESPLNIIRFSIDGSAETFKRIRGVELQKIKENILRLKKAKEAKRPELSMGVVFTVEENTQEDVEEYIEHWETIGNEDAKYTFAGRRVSSLRLPTPILGH